MRDWLLNSLNKVMASEPNLRFWVVRVWTTNHLWETLIQICLVLEFWKARIGIEFRC